MDLSIVIPLLNEDESLPELVRQIREALTGGPVSTYEVILVDDGSSDRSWEVIEELSSQFTEVKGIKFRRNYGKSAALNEGFKLASGRVVVTMDADLQDDPTEIPHLYKMIVEDKFDLVSGWKKKRYDPISKTVPSRFFNFVTRRLTRIPLHDFNCGLKAYRSEVVKSINVYGEMHRYIPVIAKWAGFRKIGEKAVTHHKRKYGKSKFGLMRFINGFLDLLTILFVSRFGKRPMHIFGLLGTLMFLFGFLAVIYMGAEKLYMINHHIRARLITDQPFFYIALATMILGTQLFLAGFIGELIARNAPDRDHYQVDKTLDRR